MHIYIYIERARYRRFSISLLVHRTLYSTCVAIPVRQRILYYSSLKGFLYYASPTKDYLLFLSQMVSLRFQSDKELFTIPLSKDFLLLTTAFCSRVVQGPRGSSGKSRHWWKTMQSIYMDVCVYIYIYIERERLCASMHRCTYVVI